ncbi:MAG: hypothetical protein HY364_01590 [Candidatus Aenigmarchaeota archaeon]|nr:hypothetical protein [Candidatus Aenigmarchaeota archaeon]
MKKLLVLYFFIALSAVSYAECSYSASIETEIEALDSQGTTNYQFPTFREDDYLALKWLRIRNTGNCTLENPEFLFQLQNNIEEKDEVFCFVKSVFTVPENITPGGIYEIKRLPDKFQYNYQDSSGREKSYCPEKLDAPGRWEISIKPDPLSHNPTNPGGYSLLIHGRHVSNSSFRVYSSLELSLADAAKQSNFLAQVAIMAAFSAIIITVGLERWKQKKEEDKHKEKQVSLLKSLAFEISQIKNNSESFDKIFKLNEEKIMKKYGQVVVSQYPIRALDAAFYIRNLDEKIEGKTTALLKRNLMRLEDKIWLVNDSWLQVKNAMVGKDLDHAKYVIEEFYKKIDTRYGKTGGHAKTDMDNLVEIIQDLLRKRFGISEPLVEEEVLFELMKQNSYEERPTS